jgi:hypothetical protein
MGEHDVYLLYIRRTGVVIIPQKHMGVGVLA